MCKRNSQNNNEASTGCVRETPRIKMKPAGDVEEKLPRLKTKQTNKKGRVRENPHIKLCKKNSPYGEGKKEEEKKKKEKKKREGMCKKRKK